MIFKDTKAEGVAQHHYSNYVFIDVFIFSKYK